MIRTLLEIVNLCVFTPNCQVNAFGHALQAFEDPSAATWVDQDDKWPNPAAADRGASPLGVLPEEQLLWQLLLGWQHQSVPAAASLHPHRLPIGP